MPKKKGAPAASTVGKKRQTASAKRVAAKKRQDAWETAEKEQAEEATATAGTSAAGGGATAELVEAVVTGEVVAAFLENEEVSGSVARGKTASAIAMMDVEEGFGAAVTPGLAEQDAHAAIVVEQTEEAAAAVSADSRDAAAVRVVNVVASIWEGHSGKSTGNGSKEVGGNVARKDAGAVMVKMEGEEELDTAAVAGLPEEGRDAHQATEAEKAEEATTSSLVEGGDAGTEITGDAVAGSHDEEEPNGPLAREEAAWIPVKLEVEHELRGGQVQLVAATAAADVVPVAAVSGLPSSLPLQMGAPMLSMTRSVDELRRLSTALSTFICCWDELSHHLDSIHASMNALSRVLDSRPPTAPAPQGTRQRKEVEMGADAQKEAGDGGAKDDKEGAEQTKKPELDLKSICEKMLGRNLRRYVVARMSEVERLREEVPNALRLAPDPAKLVLSCIGRFYLQGSRAYGDPNSPMVSVRRACILVLEFFLLSGCSLPGGDHLSFSCCDEIPSESAPTAVAEGLESSTSIKEEAKVAALSWRDRLVAEGGVASASAVDALGLTLFVASFGIPSDFDSEMINDLFQLCNMKKKVELFRQSSIIVEKLPVMIQDLIQKEKYIAAADLVCSFGYQEKYPPLDLISSFLIKTNTVAKEERRDGQCSMRSLKEAAANRLGAYKSVVKCVEDHKLDASSLASFKIEEKISKLEKDVANFEKKLKDKNLKRKAEKVEWTNELKAQEKRSASTQSNGPAVSMTMHSHDGSGDTFSGVLAKRGVGKPAGNVLGRTGAGGRGVAATTVSLFAGSGGYLSRPSAGGSGVVSYGLYRGGLGDGSIGDSYGGTGRSVQRGLIGPPPTDNLVQLLASPLGTGSRVTGAAASSSLYGFADNVMENELYYSRTARSNAVSNSASAYHHSSPYFF